jgi:hypothetical protein
MFFENGKIFKKRDDDNQPSYYARSPRFRASLGMAGQEGFQSFFFEQPEIRHGGVPSGAAAFIVSSDIT